MVCKTTNFYLAAAFLSKGANLVMIDQSDLRHLKFVFEGKDLDQLEQEWDRHTLMINAREFSEAIKDVKLKIHQITGE